MNHRRPWWIVLSLLPPLIALCALVLPSGCGGGGKGRATPAAGPTQGNVAVAFVTSPISPGNFKSVLLNIAGVRINPNPNASTNAPGWVTISVPSSAGSGNGQSPGDLQIDLMQTQTHAVFFNVGGAQQGTYQTVQVLVDPADPGTIVPACSAAGGGQEGCVNYKMQFNSALDQFTTFTLSSPISVAKDNTAPLVIELGVNIITPPSLNNGFYGITVTPGLANAGSFLAAVSGNIVATGVGKGIHLLPLQVTAELAGTNTVVETVPVTGKKHSYTLELPAFPSTIGTAYDIYVSGGGFNYAAAQNIVVTPGLSKSLADFKIKSTSFVNLTGQIVDACHPNVQLAGATLEILAPAITLASPRPTPPALGFCANPANLSQCVVVASATTDQTGFFPMPGTARHPAPFTQAPMNEADLGLRISASGYSTLLSSVYLKLSNNEICSASSSDKMCDFSLTTGFINGTVNLSTDPPPGNSVVVQVFGENSGTNQLVTALTQPLIFLHSQTSLPFQLNVPIGGAGPNFDLFAIAIDPYLGAPDPFPGHDIQVLANVAGPTAQCLQASVAPFAPMNCVGHGSITGSVINPDAETRIQVEKNGVQILGTQPGQLSSTSPSNTQYSLCVPPDSYTLDRFEAAPTASATPIAMESIAVPQPAATSSPCPSSCSNSDTSAGPCPGICNATAAGNL